MITLHFKDCFEVMKGMADGSVDLICTDPPYGILKHKIETGVDIPAFFAQCYRVLKPNSFMMFFGRQPTLSFWNAEAFKFFKYKQEIIWYKNRRASPMHDMGNVFENITVCTKGTRSFNKVYRNFCDVKQSLAEFTELDTIKRYIGDIQTIFNDKTKYEEAINYIHAVDQSIFHVVYKTRNEFSTFSKTTTKTPKVQNTKAQIIAKGLLPQNLISFTPHNKLKRDMSREGKGEFNIKHPTVKPIELMKYLIELMSNEGDVILDPFMGSGTTMLAAQELNRNGIGCEIFEDYFNIAQSRINGVNPPQSPNTPLTQASPIILNPNQISLL